MTTLACAPRVSASTQIPAGDRIPLPQKIAFSIGVNTEYMATGLLTGSLWMPYFNIGMGIRPSVLSLVLAILLTWNAFSDPLMGNISDNTRTRWGRRRPFIAVGAVLTGCLYPLFWYMPGGMGDAAEVAYLVVLGIAFFSCYTMWSMPYYGLQMELTPNYDERTRLAAWMAFFGKVSNLLGGWVLAFATSSWFTNPATGKGDIVVGMKVVCWIIAAAIICFGLAPALFVKERYYQIEVNRQPRDPFWRSLKESAHCKPMWLLIGISFFMVLGSASVATLTQYVNIYYIFDGNLSAAAVVGGWKSTVLVVTGIVLIPAWTWLAERFDKKAVLVSMILFTMIGHLTNYVCMRPDMPYLQILSGVFESAAISAVWLFIPSMKADIADHDELQTHRRREGSLNSFFSWFIKASMTCAVGMGGLVLELCGFTAKIAHQPPEVLQRMFWTYLILPVCIQGIAAIIACYYPLTRRRMGEIRLELEARRGRI
ncbi:MAG TPA: MFS transporter [Rariglobus sp.]|nr:MFS transporter [Rariglobus sp.]